MSYISLHNHSEFSFLAGVPSVKDLVARAKELGMPAVALTDTDRMSGLILFYLECRKAGIKPLLGVELTDPAGPAGEHVVLLAKNAAGYGDLCELITLRRIDPAFSFEAAFARPWENLVFMTGSPRLLGLLAATPNRCRLHAEMVNNSAASRGRSRRLEQEAAALGLPLAASNDAYFLNKSDHETHRILRAIGLNAALSRLAASEHAPAEAFFRSGGDLQRLFPDHAAALDATQRIADECCVTLDLDTWIMPSVTAPGGQRPEAHLRALALEGLERNYGGSAAYEQARRVQEMELETIAKLGYASYFLIVKEVRDWAGAALARGYRTARDATILRGSAANSITFYNLGVSDLDPIRYDLYFQRFLNEDRASPPDADLDFGWDERERALEHMVEKWGSDRVAITCTTNRFRRRAAFRETAKVFGFSEEQVTAIMKERRLKSGRVDDPEILRIAGLAEKIRGKPRFTGQHPGGVLITNDPIRRRVACEYTSGPKRRLVTQVDMHGGIDELGLIKFDLLGNGSLSVLRDTLRQLEEQGLDDPRVCDLEKCFGDPKVKDLISKGQTRGIFYIESPAQMRLNIKARAATFEEVTVTSSLVRPAGASYTRVYVERHRQMKEGRCDWEFLHPALEPILRETHDVCAFQEDVTKICHRVAGLSYKKADRIRKMMNSLHEGVLSDEEYAQTAREFLDGCSRTSGLSAAQALELWERVSSFTGFSFCKSHSASYAQLSFKCAWLKVHFPAQFLAAVVSNNHGFYSRDVYLNEARRMGIRLLPVSVNESDAAYHGRHAWIRPGLMHIRGVRRETLDALVRERESRGRFRNLADFLGRVDIHRAEAESLILAGAFDSFGMTRPELLFQLDGMHGMEQTGEPSLFDGRLPGAARTLHPGLDDYPYAARCLHELRLMGFMVSGDILDILDLHPAAAGAVPAADLRRHAGGRATVFGRPITRRPHRVARGGKAMLFITLEDRSGCADVILWPDVYERFADEAEENMPLAIRGKVTEDYGTWSLDAEHVRCVEWSPAVVDFGRASQRLERSFRRFPAAAGTEAPRAAA